MSETIVWGGHHPIISHILFNIITTLIMIIPLQLPHSEQPLSPLPQPQNIPGFRSGRDADTQPANKQDGEYKDGDDDSTINDEDGRDDKHSNRL